MGDRAGVWVLMPFDNEPYEGACALTHGQVGALIEVLSAAAKKASADTIVDPGMT